MLRDGVIDLLVVGAANVCAVGFIGGAAGVVVLVNFIFSVVGGDIGVVAKAAVSTSGLAIALTRNWTPPDLDLVVPPPETALGSDVVVISPLSCYVSKREDTAVNGHTAETKINNGESPPPPCPVKKNVRRTSAQVYLGPEITVEVTGQRALAILSRGSLVLNTSITAEPSTLGGFPGGGGVARDPGVGGGSGGSLLLSSPSLPPEFGLSSLVDGTLEGLGDGGGDVPSYNINGPGSANYRYYLFTITTSADDVDEVQRVRTSWWYSKH